MLELDPHTSGEGSAEAPAPSLILRVTGIIVSIVLALMIVLPVAQIIARKIFHTDVPGATTYTQHLTLWTGFLGAVLASISGKHLSLSTAQVLPPRARKAAEIYTAAVTAAVTALLTYGAARLVLAESVHPITLSGGVPRWASEAIMPVALAVIALRTIWRAPGRWLGRAVTLGATLAAFSFGLLGPGAAKHLLIPGSILLVVSFLLGAPVFVAMAGMAMLLFYGETPQVPIASVPTNIFELANKESIPAIPLLTIAGYVLAVGGASRRLVAAYRSLLGWLPSGMGLMVLSVCALFTAFTGASGVTILALGGVVFPLLIEENYPEGFSLGLVTAAGSLGLLFPPSLPVILYAFVAGLATPPGAPIADVKQLFVGGLIPGVIIILLVAAYTIVVGARAKTPRHSFSAREAARAFDAAKWDLLLPVIVIVSLVTGVATIVESAAIAALYSVIVEVVIFRNIHPVRDLPKAMASGATLVGAVVILMGVAYGLTAYLVDAQVPDLLLDWVKAHVVDWEIPRLHLVIPAKYIFLFALNVILLVLGSVLEMYSAIVVLAPLIVPLGIAYHINAVHLGVIFLANLELGFLFPPMGLNLFLSATRFGKPLPSLYRHALPFLAIMTVGVLIVTYVESMTTGLLKLLHME